MGKREGERETSYRPQHTRQATSSECAELAFLFRLRRKRSQHAHHLTLIIISSRWRNIERRGTQTQTRKLMRIETTCMKASVHSTKASLKFPRLPVWNVA